MVAADDGLFAEGLSSLIVIRAKPVGEGLCALPFCLLFCADVVYCHKDHQRRNSMDNLSLLLGMAAVLLFVVSSQPYAAVFAIALLTIKIFMLIRIVPHL